MEYLQSLVRELVKLPSETEWVEFKCNNKELQMIGEYISALSNSAALCERPKASLVWGVKDDTHKIVGTEFQYRKMKPFDMITKEDRIRNCYMQTCLAYVNFESINNTDIRKLFGLSIKESYKASRIIKDTMEARLLRPLDDATAPRYMKYIPYWA